MNDKIAINYILIINICFKCILQSNLGQPLKFLKSINDRLRKERTWNHTKCSIKLEVAEK